MLRRLYALLILLLLIIINSTQAKMCEIPGIRRKNIKTAGPKKGCQSRKRYFFRNGNGNNNKYKIVSYVMQRHDSAVQFEWAKGDKHWSLLAFKLFFLIIFFNYFLVISFFCNYLWNWWYFAQIACKQN